MGALSCASSYDDYLTFDLCRWEILKLVSSTWREWALTALHSNLTVSTPSHSLTHHTPSIIIYAHLCMSLTHISHTSHILTLTDVADGNMKAILSLFYNLSQLKKPGKTGSISSASATESPTSTSKLVRPVSPGLKSSHGVSHSECHTSHTYTLTHHTHTFVFKILIIRSLMLWSQIGFFSLKKTMN